VNAGTPVASGPAGFAADPAGTWTFTGSLTFDNAETVYERSAALPLPERGVVDLAGLSHADSAALAVLLALKRRATLENRPLAFEAIPEGVLALARVYGVDPLLEASAS
jgi:phospholipid transport system transporter-binding protein